MPTLRTALLKHEVAKLQEEQIRNDSFLAVSVLEDGRGATYAQEGGMAQETAQH